jgi:hypothetical protein
VAGHDGPMRANICYVLEPEAPRLTVSETQRRLTGAGLACTVLSDTKELFWMIFGQSRTKILAASQGGRVVWLTVHTCHHPDPVFLLQLDALLRALGFASSPSW